MLTAVFDVETKKTFDEVGGLLPKKLGVSVAGAWFGEVPHSLDSSYESRSLSRGSGINRRDDTLAVDSAARVSDAEVGEFRVYREDELPELFSLFERADLVVGYNIVDFDYPVLSAYYSGDLAALPTLDMLRLVEEQVGYRVKLDALAKETLGIQKSGSGLDAIRYYHDKNWEALEAYCLQDVTVTKDLYFHGLSHRALRFINKWNRVVEVGVDFSSSAPDAKRVQTTLF